MKVDLDRVFYISISPYFYLQEKSSLVGSGATVRSLD